MAVLYDNTFATERHVQSDVIFYELTGIPFDTFGTGTLRVSITVDVKDVNYPIGSSLLVYVNTPGLVISTFDDGSELGKLIVTSLPTTVYTTKTMGEAFSGTPLYIEFTGTGAPLSLYFYPPFLSPDFTEGDEFFKEAHVVVEGDAPVVPISYTTDINPFNFEKSVTQWRTQPKLSSAFDGSYVLALGYDGEAPNIEELEIGDYVQVAQSVTVTDVGLVKAKIRIKQPRSMPDYRDISTDFQLIEESVDSPGNKIVIPAGVSELDVGRYVTVTGCTNVGNNTTFKIVGILDSITAYVDQVTVTEGPRNGTITATEAGARWKLSLLVDNGGSQVERARVIQDSHESGFYRTDLSINVSKMSGAQNIYFRMTLIEHDPDNVYVMP